MFWSKLAVQALFLGASLTDASPILSNEARDLRSCNNNLALSALKLLQATNFCTDFLKITTVTIQSEHNLSFVQIPSLPCHRHSVKSYSRSRHNNHFHYQYNCYPCVNY